MLNVPLSLCPTKQLRSIIVLLENDWNHYNRISSPLDCHYILTQSNNQKIFHRCKVYDPMYIKAMWTIKKVTHTNAWLNVYISKPMHKATTNIHHSQQCCFLANQITLLTDAGLSVKTRIPLDWRLKLDTKHNLSTQFSISLHQSNHHVC